MKKLIFVLVIALAFVACEKIEESHVMVYDMQELSLGDETKLIETKVIGFRTENDNIESYIQEYEQPKVPIVVDGWTGLQWVEVRVYNIN